MAFAERYAGRLRDNGYPWWHDCETALHVAVTEVERLRKEYDHVCRDRERLYRMQGENVRLERQANELRARATDAEGGTELAAQEVERMAAELKWFEDRGDYALIVVDICTTFEALNRLMSRWDAENPRPRRRAGALSGG